MKLGTIPKAIVMAIVMAMRLPHVNLRAALHVMFWLVLGHCVPLTV